MNFSKVKGLVLGALAIAAAWVAPAPAVAGSGCSYIVTGAVLTAAQWNSCFAAKQNDLGYTPVNKAGDSMTGLLTTVAPTTTTAGFRLNPGVAPTSPTNGDIWTTSSGLYVQVNGATIGPITGGAAGSFAGTSPITVSFPAGVVTYAFDFSVANIFTARQTVNLNATATPAPITGAGLVVNPANATVGRVQANAYGAIVSFTGVVYAGTAAAPTQVLSGTQLTGINAYAYTGSAVVGPIASFRTYAAENITATAWGTKACIATTPSTTATLTDSLCQQNSGGVTVGSPTGGDKGAGTINAAGTIYINGTAVTAAGITALTGDVTATGPGSSAATLATAQPAVHTWALAQTFTVAPVFTDASGSRTALGLGTAAVQNIGTSGANVPLLSTANTWTLGQTFSAAMTYGGVTLSNSVTGIGGMMLAASPTTTGTLTAAIINSSGQFTNALGTITTSAPATFTQTWNSSGVTFTGVLVNVTSTASAAASLLQDWQLAGTSQVSIRRDGTFTTVAGLRLGYTSGTLYTFDIGFSAGSVQIVSGYTFGWAASTTNAGTGADTAISRIAAGITGFGTGAAGSIAGGIQAATAALGGATIGGNTLAVTGTIVGSSTISSPDIYVTNGGNIQAEIFGSATVPGLYLASSAFVAWGPNTSTGSNDLFLRREAANTLIQRNAANAQKLSVCNTYTSVSNYECGVLDWTIAANVFYIGTQTVGGTQRNLRVDSATTSFQIAGTTAWQINSSLFLLPFADNSYDLGGTSNKIRSIYIGTNASVAGAIINAGITSDSGHTTGTVCQDTTSHQYYTGSGALGVCLGTSGLQFKTEITPMVAGLDDLMKVDFVNYRYRAGYGDGGARKQYGTTAQNVEAAMPDLARQNASGETINFDSGALLFIGLRAIQQLKAENDNVKAANDNLRAEFEKLKAAR